jgi:hypothetical protein
MIINAHKSTIFFTSMEVEAVYFYQSLFPFSTLDFLEGIKYLGFQLKANDYRKVEWRWRMEKLEKRLKGWSFKWLSREGRLILAKSILEAIPVYWMPMVWIPKGILDKARWICLCFIWSKPQDQHTPPWAKWDCLSRQKALGGWGMKNIFMFSKSLAAKFGWRFLLSASLWTSVVEHKYIRSDSLEDWIRKLVKSHPNCSIIWKVVISSFPVVGDGLSWRVDKCDRAQIGVDPWLRCGISHIMPNDLS